MSAMPPIATENVAASRMVAKCHVWTAPAVQGKNRTFQRAGRVQPCIRPLNAAAVAAGPDVNPLIGSQPLARVQVSHGTCNGSSQSTVSTVSHQCRHHPLQFMNALTHATSYFRCSVVLKPQIEQPDRFCRSS